MREATQRNSRRKRTPPPRVRNLPSRRAWTTELRCASRQCTPLHSLAPRPRSAAATTAVVATACSIPILDATPFRTPPTPQCGEGSRQVMVVAKDTRLCLERHGSGCGVVTFFRDAERGGLSHSGAGGENGTSSRFTRIADGWSWSRDLRPAFPVFSNSPGSAEPAWRTPQCSS